ncbi:hypothetical protein [Membranihabitans maritimus]|uniref:hypothetical protein n=1 Tax=Membranihabitans maritimus TaxID=2904244 RepID=UPI001F2372D0|nr:hypothetical protein [Membranihabitans maritimus]
MVLNVCKSVQNLLLFIMIISGLISCSSSNDSLEKELIGKYNGQVISASFNPEVKSMAQSTRVKFEFNADNTAVYETSAMGQNRRAEGKFRVQNDSLYIYDLGVVPDGYFKLTKLDNGQWKLNGIGNFLLTPVDNQ